MRMKTINWVGIGIGLIVVIVSLILLKDTKYLFLMVGLGVIIGILPFLITILLDSKRESEKEQMFLEFSRDLVESVKTGTPISKSIINLKDKPYGPLSENVRKLANQISIGIPLNTALQIFSKDINNQSISRSISLIGHAEKSGGNIGTILESVAEAVTLTDKLKKERKSTISTLVVQGYIIFIIFLVIILIMQIKILPMMSGIGSIGSIGTDVKNTAPTNNNLEFVNSFIYLLLVQGFFSGLVIGLMSEENIKAGIKHSFALMILSYLTASIARIITT